MFVCLSVPLFVHCLFVCLSVVHSSKCYEVLIGGTLVQKCVFNLSTVVISTFAVSLLIHLSGPSACLPVVHCLLVQDFH